jgi:Cu2+-exporting ATPase
VLLQRLDALEALTRVRRFYLDKTGTVTDERLQPQTLQRLPALNGSAWAGWNDERLRARAVSLAAWSAHPLSQALQEWGAAGDGVVWRDVHEQAGAGVDARDEAGRQWRLGAAAFVAGAATAADGALGTDAAGPAVWLGCDGVALARIAFDETLRPDAVATVAALRAQGLQVVLLSGDRADRAERMGHRLGVDAVVAQATPERKLAEVVAAQAAGLAVAMVGDGINDAPVLARADVSVAMGQGALIARAQADATLASGRLADLVWMRDLSRRTMRVVRQNIGWAVGYNLACIPLALGGFLPPWAAGLGMASSSLLVIANAVRLAR